MSEHHGRIRYLVAALVIAGVATAAIVSWKLCTGSPRSFINSTASPESEVHKVLLTSGGEQVLNLATGKLIAKIDALNLGASHVRLMRIKHEFVRGQSRSLRERIAGTRASWGALLVVENVDLDYAPADSDGWPLLDYWADANPGNWPGVAPRKTSIYTWHVKYDKLGYPILFRTRDGMTGVMRVTNVRSGQAELEYWIVSMPGAVSAPEDRFAVTLSNGTRIEVIGLSCSPTTGNGWWKPNGEPLWRAPYSNERPVSRPRPDRIVREFACRVTCPSSSNGGGTRSSTSGSQGSGSFSIEDEFGEHIYEIPGERRYFRKGTETTDWRVGVALGDWQTVLVSGEGKEETASEPMYVSISPPTVKDGKTFVDMTMSWDWHEYATRLVGIGWDGEEYRSHKRHMRDLKPASLRRIRYNVRFHKEPPEGFREFRFQFREYETVRFKNISLIPGKITNVEIERVAPPGQEGN